MSSLVINSLIKLYRFYKRKKQFLFFSPYCNFYKLYYYREQQQNLLKKKLLLLLLNYKKSFQTHTLTNSVFFVCFCMKHHTKINHHYFGFYKFFVFFCCCFGFFLEIFLSLKAMLWKNMVADQQTVSFIYIYFRL